MVDASTLYAISGGLLSGTTPQQQLGNMFTNLGTVTAEQKAKTEQTAQLNQTREWLKAQDPANAAKYDALPDTALGAVFGQVVQNQYAAKKPAEFKTVGDALYNTESGEWITPPASALQNKNMTAIQRDLQAAGLEPGSPEYQKAILENYRKNGGQDDYANREAQALKLGMKPDDPRYESFILTGKLPREDQQTLTAVDKKAILEADEMVAVNEGAINALKQAKDLSPKANAGWFSGTRATLGNNLPDWMVPDDVSSPDSSVATQDFDNAIVGQALTQLKAIFGGAPTEGERKILLDLQGSSNLQPEVRDKIIDRAIAAAERRLEFNRQRADEMRGGTYYKPNSADTQQPAPVDGANTTSTGVKWKVPGQ